MSTDCSRRQVLDRFAAVGAHAARLAIAALVAACSSPIVEVICDPTTPDASPKSCVAAADSGALPPAPAIYPQGEQMALGLYELEAEADLVAAARSGWNIGHSYATTPTSVAFLRLCGGAGLHALGRLAGKNEPLPEPEAVGDIARLAASDALLWWDLPEQLRYWRDGEMEIVRSYARLTRAHDPRKRPVFMYIPGHYDAAAVEPYVPYLDVIPSAVYPEFQGQPHAWARWRIEETLEGIRRAKAPIGRNYLMGDKTPVAILQLFTDGATRVPTVEGVVHDLWQSLVSGARGILVSSFAKRDEHPNLSAAWQRIDEAARLLTGPEMLARALLDGQAPDRPIVTEVLSGPTRTPEFKPWVPEGQTAVAVSYPAIDALAVVHGGRHYAIVVNSAEATVQMRISGLPVGATNARLLLGGRDVALGEGTVTLSLPALGVEIMRVPVSDSGRPAP